MRAELLLACGEAIEGLGRLREVVQRTGEDEPLRYRYDLMAMLEVAYSMLHRIEMAIRNNGM